jgi:hypothetical protein
MRTALWNLGVWPGITAGVSYSERPVSYYNILPEKRDAARRAATKRIPLVAASADQRGFLVIYERPGSQLNIADIYELVGMAVVA